MVGSHSLSTCRVKFAAWGRGFVVVGLNSSPLGWVEFAAVGLGWIRCGWVGYSPWFFTRCRWVVFTGLGWVRRHRVWLGFTHCRWVGLAALGWICRRRVGFAVVGLYSSLLGSHSPSSGYIRPHCAQFSLTGPLANIGCVGFTIVDPTCRCWVQPIAVGLVGCDCDCFSLARAEELREMEGKT